jgi:hypothetical protein
MNIRFKIFASYNILQYLCDFIHVLIFVTVSKCRKSPKLTNIVMKSMSFGEERGPVDRMLSLSANTKLDRSYKTASSDGYRPLSQNFMLQAGDPCVVALVFPGLLETL